jgi:DNA polymerase-1
LTLLVVDVSGLIHKSAHRPGAMLTRSDGLPVRVTYGLVAQLWNRCSRIEATHAAIAYDHPGPNWRHDIWPAYKATRPAQTGQPHKEMAKEREHLRAAAEAFGAPVSAAGFEADDVVATLVRLAREADMPVEIVSTDKDLQQLVSPTVALHTQVDYNWRRFGPADCLIRFGVPPEKMIDFQALMGDATDNVPGAKGIGKVTAAKIIQRFGSIEMAIACAEDIMWPSAREAVIRDADNIRISKRVVALRDDAPTPPLESFRLPADRWAALREVCRRLEFQSFAEKIPPPYEMEMPA